MKFVGRDLKGYHTLWAPSIDRVTTLLLNLLLKLIVNIIFCIISQVRIKAWDLAPVHNWTSIYILSKRMGSIE